MADETREANVVLTADTSGYSAGMQRASSQTADLAAGVDKLSASISNLIKAAGRKLVLFGATDAAAVTAVTVAAARYEKQLTTLNASLVLAGKNTEAYRKGVNQLARVYSTSRGDIAQLATQLNELGIKSQQTSQSMSETFIKLSAATGSNLNSMAQGMVLLGRTMGTINSGPKAMSGFADSLTKVSNEAGVSAQAVVDFGQTIAPFAKMAGIGEKELLGISAAFTAAGADGYAAANTFNSMLADITRQIQNGSPDIAKYSNLIGTTVGQFKEMDATERIIQIFEAINAQGPDAIKTLDRLGYDGIRAAKAITQVSQQAGGLRAAVATSVGAYGSGATDTAAEAAFDSLADTTGKIKNNLGEMSATLGAFPLAVVKGIGGVFNSLLTTVNALGGPLLAVSGMLATILGPTAGGAGAALLLAKVASTVNMMAFAGNNSGFKAFREGMSVVRTGKPNETVFRMNEGSLNWYQRMAANQGMALGMAIPGGWDLKQMLGAAPYGALRLTKILADAQTQFFNDAGTLNSYNRKPGVMANTPGFLRSMLFHPGAFLGSMFTSGPGTVVEASRDYRAGRGKYAGLASESEAIAAALKDREAERASMQDTTKKQRSLGRASAEAAGSLARLGFADVKNAAKIGAYTGWNLLKAGASALGGPMLGVMGGVAVASAYANQMQTREAEWNYRPDQSTYGIAAINASLGRATETVRDFDLSLKKSAEKVTDMGVAAKVTQQNMMQANGQTIDPGLKALSAVENLAEYLTAQGKLDAEQLNAFKIEALKRFQDQEGVQKELTQYVAQGKSPMLSSEQITDLVQGVTQQGGTATQGSFWTKYMQWLGLGGPSEETQTAVANVMTGVKTRSADITTLYGAQAGQQSMITGIYDVTKAALDESLGTWDWTSSGLGNSTDQVARRNAAVTAIAQAFEGQFDNGDEARMIADYVIQNGRGKTPEELMQEFLKQMAASDDEGARNWLNNQNEKGLVFGPGANAFLQRLISGGGDPNSFINRLAGTQLGGVSGANLKANEVLLSAISGTGDPNVMIQAMNDLAFSATRVGGSFADAIPILQQWKATAKSTTEDAYKLADAAQQNVMAWAQMQANEGGRFSSWDMSMQLSEMLINTPGESPDAQAQREQGLKQRQQTVMDVRSYLQNMIMAHLQYKRQMKRSEEDYEVSVQRAEDDYYRQRRWAQADYHRQVRYAEEDHNRQMRYMAEDAAKSLYDPYKRAYTTATASTSQILSNLADQNEKIQQQTANLRKAQQMGLSQKAIDVLNLASPEEADQLARIIEEAQDNPQVIAQLNKRIKTRQGAATDLTQNDWNQSFRRFEEGYERSLERAEEQFKKSMDRADKQYQTSVTRMAEDHEKMLKRAKRDLSRFGEEITGSMTELYDRAYKLLGKNLGRLGDRSMAQLEEFKNTYGPMFGDPDAFWAWLTGKDATTSNAGEEYPGGVAGTEEGYNPNSQRDDYPGPRNTEQGYNPRENQTPIEQRYEYDPDGNLNLRGMAAGGIVTARQLVLMAEQASPEAVIPLNSSGEEFMLKVMRRATDALVRGSHTSAHPGPVTSSSRTYVDHSTTYTGDIKVQADDPRRMEKELDRRKRVANLRRGAYAM